MVNQNVLKYIMNLAVNDNAFIQVNAIANINLNKIAAIMDNDVYSNQIRRLIEQFKKDPEKFVLKRASGIPDGSPIGSDTCSYNIID